MEVNYFAYGSNMDQQRLLSRDVIFSKKLKGMITNWQLVFNKVARNKEGVGWANIVPKESSVVEGIIYKITEQSIANLDYYEGYPDHYEKKEMPVESNDGILNCIVYVAKPTKVSEGLKPTKEYLNHLLKENEFLSKSYLSHLEKIQTID